MILPGKTIGVLGGGQLGRMSILAGRRMGYNFIVYDPSPDATAARVADQHICASYDDFSALEQFVSLVDVITLEFENISLAAIAFLEKYKTVFPSSKILKVCQNRIAEKAFFQENQFECVKSVTVSSEVELAKALSDFVSPCVLKSSMLGYDGKGQIKIEDPQSADTRELWAELNAVSAILEEWIDLASECSVICARNELGSLKAFPVALNYHEAHILQSSRVPSGLTPELEDKVMSIALEIATLFELVGLLAVEFFITKEGRVLVNEMAPRPHNSGHYTLDACVTSQFEQHIRAVCGLPLGSTELLRPAVMVNLLGELWDKGEPDWAALLQDPQLKLHLYGKGEARRGRKMGHISILAQDIQVAEDEVLDQMKHYAS